MQRRAVGRAPCALRTTKSRRMLRKLVQATTHIHEARTVKFIAATPAMMATGAVPAQPLPTILSRKGLRCLQCVEEGIGRYTRLQLHSDSVPVNEENMKYKLHHMIADMQELNLNSTAEMTVQGSPALYSTTYHKLKHDLRPADFPSTS